MVPACRDGAYRGNGSDSSGGRLRWGKPQQFSGTYTVADNLLVLRQGNNPMLVGQVAPLAGGAPGGYPLVGAGRFNFKLVGDNPGDPGLTFVR